MSSQFVELEEKGFWISTGLLELWLLMLVREIDRTEPPSQWSQEARGHWHLQATAGFGGFISVNLDRFAASDEDREYLIQLGQAALASLEDVEHSVENDLYVLPPTGAKWNAEQGWLNHTLGALHEHARYNLRKLGELFIKLVQGEVTWKVSDSDAVCWTRDTFKY